SERAGRSRCGLVDLLRQTGGLVPAEGARALNAGLARPRERALHACSDIRDVERVDEDRRAPGDLFGRAATRGDDRDAAGHRLEHGNAEALVERGIDEAAGAAVEARELVVADPAEPADIGAANGDAAPSFRACDAQLDAEALGGLDRALEVLARLERADGEPVVAV